MTYEGLFCSRIRRRISGIINESINEQMSKGDLYYDCWEVTSDDFFTSKTTLCLMATLLYFDDCVICPSYTGTYSIELPLMDLLSVLKNMI
jgi:hypothetical protein